MFSSFIVRAINPVIEKYVENLDPKQLSVSITSGEVILNDVQIKRWFISFLLVLYHFVQYDSGWFLVDGRLLSVVL